MFETKKTNVYMENYTVMTNELKAGFLMVKKTFSKQSEGTTASSKHKYLALARMSSKGNLIANGF